KEGEEEELITLVIEPDEIDKLVSELTEKINQYQKYMSPITAGAGAEVTKGVIASQVEKQLEGYFNKIVERGATIEQYIDARQLIRKQLGDKKLGALRSIAEEAAGPIPFLGQLLRPIVPAKLREAPKEKWIDLTIETLKITPGEPASRTRRCLLFYKKGSKADDYLTEKNALKYFTAGGQYLLEDLLTHYRQRVDDAKKSAQNLQVFLDAVLDIDAEIFSGCWKISSLYNIHGDTDARAKDMGLYLISRQTNPQHILYIYGEE
ncbi:MAG: hypothetical protein AB1566_12930, partial [Chloroflexota bacterium]